MRFNTDERLRGMERKLEAEGGGAPAEQAAYLRERLRAGQVTEDEVLSQARSGDQAALLALDLTLPQVRMIDSLGGRGRKPRNTGEAERAIRAYYGAMGFQPDRFGALVGTVGSTGARLVFKTRVVEEHHGRPGAWRKVQGLSMVKHAEALMAKAAGPAGEAALKEKRKVEKVKTAERRTKEQTKRNVLRTAAVLMSLDLTPEQRRLSFVDSRSLEPAALALVAPVESQLDDGATQEQVDAMLSVSAPPVFLPSDQRGDRDWPASYKWRDAASGLEIEVKRKPGNRSVSILIGNVQVDPISGGVIPERMFSDDEAGHTGISGVIRVGVFSDDEPQAQLYFIQSARRREGVARRMIRVFCRIVTAYGFDSFVILGVNEESAAMALGLDQEGELKIIGRSGSNVFVKCTGALDDPRQQRLFGPQPKSNPTRR